jgi:hypothetical protein
LRGSKKAPVRDRYARHPEVLEDEMQKEFGPRKRNLDAGDDIMNPAGRERLQF